MNNDLNPDAAEMHLADQMDDIVPSYGYQRTPVIGLGGSAGSIEALQQFFSTMPPQQAIAFVVVIHLPREHESNLPQVLQRLTRMKVLQVQEDQKIAPGTVYVIPPGKLLTCVGDWLHLTELPPLNVRHVAVDVFFRSLADTHAAHAAAIVLSGLDGDGSIGIKRVKERGGLTLAQDPGQAMHGGMPYAAIDSGMLDWILPVQEMPGRLLAYFRMEKEVQPSPQHYAEAAAAPAAADEATLREILSFLRARSGRDFQNYKRGTVVRRIGRRMQVNGVDNFAGYLQCLRTRPGEASALLNDLLISVTNFFRDGECFAALEEHLAALFAGKRPGDTVRAWCIACATGEEAYSLAMLLSDHARNMEQPPAIQVFATDINEEAVQHARQGLYPGAIEADVGEDHLRRYFVKEHNSYRVRRELREMVLFAVHDVLRDSPFSRLDLVTCRNLLIYLDRHAQRRVLDIAHFALRPHGRLFLGSSEAVDEDNAGFDALDKKHRIYEQRPVSRTGLPLPPPPSDLQLDAQRPSALIVPTLAGAVFDRVLGPVPPLAPASPAGDLSWGEFHLHLLDRLSPPSLLVDGAHMLLHVSPGATRFLTMPPGEPSRDLLHLLEPALRIEVRTALTQAAQTHAEVDVPPVSVAAGHEKESVRLRVLPAGDLHGPVYLVQFLLSEGPQAVAPAPGDDAAQTRSVYLDQEVDRLKYQLRAMAEQYEAALEEHKAGNEELQAMNEELRSGTEELETSREELQSINEELTTVNQALKGKVDELGRTNSDMHNLMDATPFATIFLDRELRITRYSPPAVALFSLIRSDVGRPITDLKTELDYRELAGDARKVLEGLVPIEREVTHSDGRHYMARLLPYRTLDDRIAGVVFSFIDITDRKRAEETAQWLATVVSSSPDAIISFALDGSILSWNIGAQQVFGYGAEQTVGHPFDLLMAGQEPSARRIVSTAASGESLQNVHTRWKASDGHAVELSLTVSPIRSAGGGVIAGTCIARDITRQLQADLELARSNALLRKIVESTKDFAIFSMDPERRITSWNSGAETVLGFSEAEALGKPADMIFTPEDRANGVPKGEAETALRNGKAEDEREHVRKGGQRFRGSGSMSVMRDNAGNAIGFVKIMRDLSRRDRSAAPATREPSR